MRFHLGHPNAIPYAFNLLALKPDLERAINRLGPVDLVSRAFDWPRVFGGFRGWTDKINSLWWPVGAEQFSTCVVVIDDARNDKLAQGLQIQQDAVPLGGWRWPYLILSARLAPQDPPGEPGTGLLPEAFPPRNVGPVEKETELIAWKLYPLQPINICSLVPSERFRGLWLLPLVDVRYFHRNTPLNRPFGGSSSSSSSGSGTTSAYPIIEIDRSENNPTWMPPLRVHPQDLTTPINYVPIINNGTEQTIDSLSSYGEAADKQALMNGWRIVNRDVRSEYNSDIVNGIPPHDQFTGIVADYPEDFELDVLAHGYHLDVCQLAVMLQCREAGGLCDDRTLDDTTVRKIQFLFDVQGTKSVAYCITLQTIKDYPEHIFDFVEDVDGPDTTEKTLIPNVHLGPIVSSRHPDTVERAALVYAARQWFLLYCFWRRKQGYFKFPGIFPLIPNGHAQMIRWDFQVECCETTYIALEGVEGTHTQDRRGGTGDACFWVVLTRKEYASGNPFILYSAIRVIESDGVTYTLGDPVTLPIYHVQNVDLPVWFDMGGGKSGSGSGSSGGGVPEECVCRACPAPSGEFYFIDDQPRIEFVSITGNFDGSGGSTAPGVQVTWDQEKDEVAILDPDIRIVDLNALV